MRDRIVLESRRSGERLAGPSRIGTGDASYWSRSIGLRPLCPIRLIVVDARSRGYAKPGSGDEGEPVLDESRRGGTVLLSVPVVARWPL